MSKSTMVELVKELEELNSSDKGVLELIAEAKAGEYHDYKNQKYACGKMHSYNEFKRISMEIAEEEGPQSKVAQRLFDLAEEIKEGEYDEQADAEDIAYMKSFAPKGLHGFLGLDK